MPPASRLPARRSSSRQSRPPRRDVRRHPAIASPLRRRRPLRAPRRGRHRDPRTRRARPPGSAAARLRPISPHPTMATPRFIGKWLSETLNSTLWRLRRCFAAPFGAAIVGEQRAAGGDIRLIERCAMPRQPPPRIPRRRDHATGDAAAQAAVTDPRCHSPGTATFMRAPPESPDSPAGIRACG